MDISKILSITPKQTPNPMQTKGENRSGGYLVVINESRKIRSAYKSYFFSQQIIFFSHNKSANNIFSHNLSAKRAEHW